MKQFLSIFVAAYVFFSAFSQQPMVTLSHNGELSFFNNIDAFSEALDSAKNGDVIYLSEGNFTSKTQSITIEKKISVIGSGRKSHIIPSIHIDLSNNPQDTGMSTPMFDGVWIEGLTFNTSEASRDALGNVIIANSRIGYLSNVGFAGKETLIDKCLIYHIEIINENFNVGRYNNVKISSSKIGTLKNWGQCAMLYNCNVGSTDDCPRLIVSSIIDNSDKMIAEGTNYQYNSHVIINSLLHGEDIVDSSKIVVYDSYFHGDEALLDENLECPLNLAELGYLGEDGTVVGIQGGEFPFTENPSVPTVDSANSSVTYEAEDNKLKVHVTVKAD